MSKAKLPPEALKFMSAMGLDLGGLEPEAEDVWRKLNKMQREDPTGYDAFVQQQMEEAKMDEAGLSGKGGGNEKGPVDDDTKRSLRPDAGFCVETETYSGDGIKIREYDDVKQRNKGKPIFVNICTSKAIECPTDRNGKKVETLRSTADGLSLPLLIGPMRDLENNSLAIDVIVHPIVLDMSLSGKHFKKQVLDLAFEWIMDENEGLKFYMDGFEDYTPEDKASYKGGRGENEDVPVLFIVDLEAEEAKRKKAMEKDSSTTVKSAGSSSSSSSNASLDPSKPDKDALGSTSSLLSHVINDRSGTEPEIGRIGKLNLNAKETKTKTIGTGSMVQEVGKEKEPTPTPTPAPTPTPTPKETKKNKDDGGLFKKIGKQMKNKDQDQDTFFSTKAPKGQGEDKESKGGKQLPTKLESEEIDSMLSEFDEEFSTGRGKVKMPSYTLLYPPIPSYTLLCPPIPSYTLLYPPIPSYTLLYLSSVPL